LIGNDQEFVISCAKIANCEDIPRRLWPEPENIIAAAACYGCFGMNDDKVIAIIGSRLASTITPDNTGDSS
jgi:hypothetical protein